MSASWLTFRRLAIVAALGAPAIVACARDLNPQPLPPESANGKEEDDRGTGGQFSEDPSASPSHNADGGLNPPDDGGDAGDPDAGADAGS